MKFNLSNRQIRILNQVLNEVCNGIPLQNFELSIGAQREAAEQLLRRLLAIYRQQDNDLAEEDILTIPLNTAEISIIKNSINILMKYFDESDFDTRVGCNKNEAIVIKENLI